MNLEGTSKEAGALRADWEQLTAERYPQHLAFFRSLSELQWDRLIRFYQLVIQENQVQNLTRLLSVEQFFEGHVLDAVELLKSNLLNYPALDLGSGVGVPGMICAILDGQAWILCESEKKKAEFLARASQALGLDNVKVVPERIEVFLKSREASVSSIVARAVGPVGRIYGWIRQCSTWNNLVLLKGPSWESEWEEFQKEKNKKAKGLHILSHSSYQVGLEKKARTIIKLGITR